MIITLGIETVEHETEEDGPVFKKNKLDVSLQFMSIAKKRDDEILVYERAQIPVIDSDQDILEWWTNNGNMFPSIRNLWHLKYFPFLHHLRLQERIFSTSGESLKQEEVH